MTSIGTAEIHFVEVGGGDFDNDGRDDLVTYQPVTAGWDILKQAPFAGSGLDGNDDLGAIDQVDKGSIWGGSGSEASLGTQQRWDCTASTLEPVIEADLSLSSVEKGDIPATLAEYGLLLA